MVLVLNQSMFAVQTQTAGRLPRPVANTISVPKANLVPAITQAAPKKFRIVEIFTLSCLKKHIKYTEFHYTRVSPTIIRTFHVHKLPLLSERRSEICPTSEEVAREWNIDWICGDWEMITTNGNRSDLMKVSESVAVNIHGIMIPMPIVLAKSGSEQVILCHPWETYAQQCERNLDNGSCEITITAIDGSEQVTFVATFPGDKRDRFTSS